MRQRDESPSPQTYRYSVAGEISRSIDELLQQLAPYPHLDLLREVFVTGVKLAQENCTRGDLKIVRTSIKELRYGFKLFCAYKDVPKISMFGSARVLPEDPEFKAAAEFARRMTGHGYKIITGAGPGIMAAGHQGAGVDNSFGLNILLPFEQEANPIILGDRKLINFFYFFTRKLFFIKESDAIVLMPGGFGTQDEGFEALTLIQTGKNEPTPIVMLDRPGGTYWKSWYRFVWNELFQRGYVSLEDEKLFVITESIDEACEEIRTFYRRYHSMRYVDRRQKLVIRLKEEVSPAVIEKLNEDFQDIIAGQNRIETCQPFPEEREDLDVLDLPRIVFPFDQRHFGRLRELIDAINRA
ncbi:MAG: LOG family protein [Acidobacteriota bacterium]